MLYRDDHYEDASPGAGEIGILVRSNRDGALGPLRSGWQPERMRSSGCRTPHACRHGNRLRRRAGAITSGCG